MISNNTAPAPSRPGQGPSLAIIGMEGSGKTVLATTLAKHLSTIDSRGVFLNPQGVKTLKYVEGVWHTLQSGEWPPSTPPGELFDLRWTLQIVGDLDCDVRLIDPAGQDLRTLFGEERISSQEPLPGQLQSLADYCRSAHIILFLINLQDFVGHSTHEQRTANEATMKAAMDFFAKERARRRTCLVLTQVDLYRGFAEERGGWYEIARESFPYVFGAHIQGRSVKVHPVAAVADTRVVVSEDRSPRRVPVGGFRSEGLDELVQWLIESVREVSSELQQEMISGRLTDASQPNPSRPPPSDSSGAPTPLLMPIVGIVLALIVGLVLFRGCIPGCNSATPVTFRWGFTWGVFNDDVWIENTSKIRLTNVRVFVDVKNNGVFFKRIDLSVPELGPFQKYTWTNVISVPGGNDSTTSGSIATLKCDQN